MPSEEIQRKLGALQALQAVLLCAVILALSLTAGLSGCAAVRAESNAGRLEQVATETHLALCSLRRGIEISHDKRDQYVVDVEAGRRKLIEGITLAEIKDSIANQEDRLRELAVLDCEEGVK